MSSNILDKFLSRRNSPNKVRHVSNMNSELHDPEQTGRADKTTVDNSKDLDGATIHGRRYGKDYPCAGKDISEIPPDRVRRSVSSSHLETSPERPSRKKRLQVPVDLLEKETWRSVETAGQRVRRAVSDLEGPPESLRTEQRQWDGAILHSVESNPLPASAGRRVGRSLANPERDPQPSNRGEMSRNHGEDRIKDHQSPVEKELWKDEHEKPISHNPEGTILVHSREHRQAPVGILKKERLKEQRHIKDLETNPKALNEDHYTSHVTKQHQLLPTDSVEKDYLKGQRNRHISDIMEATSELPKTTDLPHYYKYTVTDQRVRCALDDFDIIPLDEPAYSRKCQVPADRLENGIWENQCESSALNNLDVDPKLLDRDDQLQNDSKIHIPDNRQVPACQIDNIASRGMELVINNLKTNPESSYSFDNTQEEEKQQVRLEIPEKTVTRTLIPMSSTRDELSSDYEDNHSIKQHQTLAGLIENNGLTSQHEGGILDNLDNGLESSKRNDLLTNHNASRAKEHDQVPTVQLEERAILEARNEDISLHSHDVKKQHQLQEDLLKEDSLKVEQVGSTSDNLQDISGSLDRDDMTHIPSTSASEKQGSRTGDKEQTQIPDSCPGCSELETLREELRKQGRKQVETARELSALRSELAKVEEMVGERKKIIESVCNKYLWLKQRKDEQKKRLEQEVETLEEVLREAMTLLECPRCRSLARARRPSSRHSLPPAKARPRSSGGGILGTISRLKWFTAQLAASKSQFKSTTESATSIHKLLP